MQGSNASGTLRVARSASAAIALVLCVTTMLPAAFAAEGAARKAVMANGLEDYAENCAACHGAGGKGGGDLATKLVKPPKALDSIASANGGTFPFWRVFSIIAGEAPVDGHDTHQMPEFYARLKTDDTKPGYLPAHMRVLALTHYVESLQK